MCNAKVGILGFGLDCVNSLDCVRNICKVYKGAVPVGRQQVNKGGKNTRGLLLL